MPVAVPIVGTNAVVELVPIGGGSTIVIKNSDWEITPKNNVAEAPNTTDGMLRAPGLFDYEGSFKGSVDTTSTSTAIESQVKAGNIYTFKLYRNKAASTYYAGTIILGSIKVSTGLSTVENYDIPFMKQSGLLVYPDGSSQ